MANINEVPIDEINRSTLKVKKVRTEAQIRATEKMLKKRKELLDFRDEDAMTVAQEMYAEKKTRRDQKKTLMENLVEEKMEKYHLKLLDEINKPLTGYWTKIFSEDEEIVPLKAAPEPEPELRSKPLEVPKQPSWKQQWEEERQRNSDLAKTKRLTNGKNPYSQNLREKHDFSRWIK